MNLPVNAPESSRILLSRRQVQLTYLLQVFPLQHADWWSIENILEQVVTVIE